MTQGLNTEIIKRWVEEQGGEKIAALKIVEAIDCSFSMAEKIAAGRYLSLPGRKFKQKLAVLIKGAIPLGHKPKRKAS